MSTEPEGVRVAREVKAHELVVAAITATRAQDREALLQLVSAITRLELVAMSAVALSWCASLIETLAELTDRTPESLIQFLAVSIQDGSFFEE